jgi:hypothetical protein
MQLAMIRSEGVSGILCQARLDKLDNSNSPLLHNCIPSQGSVREEMKIDKCSQSVRDTNCTHCQILVCPSFETASESAAFWGGGGGVGKL